MRLSRLQKAVLIKSCVSSGSSQPHARSFSACKKTAYGFTRHPFFRLQKKVAC
ncbi:hypothetical protein AB434_2580 [Heyndrickxia coagulans]|uniref:Uncharacterized protein n=1 Tax=Heyndrickxia coagulans TaxID=1398 RepID=A0AAN0T8I0_HEYCO|nr:hypothetical protein SB48_HM08orf04334 [Heyndrickxia coagulans]AKN54985.1 hypothetical protein AB434_2580 [Heyndrickxia coagulans]